MENNVYLLLNTFDVPVARGRLLNHPDAPQLQVKLVEGQIEAIEALETVKLVGLSIDMPTLRGKLLRCTNDSFILGDIESGESIRETLRVPVNFETLLYPLDGNWMGRRKVRFVDLSGGGIAFSSDEPMERGERFEVVIPITSPAPLVLKAQVLRIRQRGETTIYAAKFVDLCYDEEKLICEAVFAEQIRQHKQQTRRNDGRKGDLP